MQGHWISEDALQRGINDLRDNGWSVSSGNWQELPGYRENPTYDRRPKKSLQSSLITSDVQAEKMGARYKGQCDREQQQVPSPQLGLMFIGAVIGVAYILK